MCWVQALNRELKVVAAAIKEAFDQMPAHGTTYPGTKAPMAAAARHLRPAAKNLLTAAKSVNEAPGTSLPRSLCSTLSPRSRCVSCARAMVRVRSMQKIVRQGLRCWRQPAN